MSVLSTMRFGLGVGLLLSTVACGDSGGTGGGGTGGGGTGGEGTGGAGEGDACDVEDSFQPCYLAGDPDGSPSGGQQCVDDGQGNLVWNACQNAGTAASTPLVLSFDGAPVVLSMARGTFGLDASASTTTDWPTASTPWLAIDRDGDGRIESGAELFGSAVRLASGELAPNGFVALAELDGDGDGMLRPGDASWSRLSLWSDTDQDRSSEGELVSLDARGLEAISLTYASDRRCDARGNCEVERAAFWYRDATGALREGVVVDVHLAHR